MDLKKLEDTGIGRRGEKIEAEFMEKYQMGAS